MLIRGKSFDLGKILHSVLFFSAGFFKKREYDVVFYYPAHFNRDSDGGNPYFKHMIETCNTHGLRYVIFEEPTFDGKDARNDAAIPFDFPFMLITLLRKLIPLEKYETFFHREWKIATIMKPLFFRRFTFRNYIVLSQSMLGFFRGLNSSAKLFDCQHGIIYTFHPGYFKENRMPVDDLWINKASILLYGEGFAQLIRKGDISGYYKTHTYVIGQPVKRKRETSEKIPRQTNNRILFTSAIVGDDTISKKDQYRILLDFLRTNSDFFIDRKLIFSFHHHPRYRHDMDMSELFSLPFVEENRLPIDIALKNAFLHMTMISTTTFEAAELKIPTLIWNRHFKTIYDVFVKEYAYPLGLCTDEDLLKKISTYLKYPDKYTADGDVVYTWYRRFYSDYNSDVLLRMFR